MISPINSESDQKNFFKSWLHKAMELNSPFYASLSRDRKVVYIRQYKLQAVVFIVILAAMTLGILSGQQTGRIAGFAILSILAFSIYSLIRKQTSGQLLIGQYRSNHEKSRAQREELESFAQQLQKESKDV